MRLGSKDQGKGKKQIVRGKVKELKKSGRKCFHIHFIGDGQEYAEQLKDYCEKEELMEVVAFHGYQGDVDSILDTMNVGVICSKSEAFGRVTVEYMLSSLPVIGAAGAGTSEIVEDKKTGLLYQSGNVRQLVQCMTRLIDDRMLCDKMGEAGYYRAKEKFMMQRNTDEMMQVFQSLCK